MIDEWEESVLNKTIKSFYNYYDSGYIQKKSFDHFIHFRLNKIVEEESRLEVPINATEKYVVEFGQVFVDNPYIIDENRNLKYITPHEARVREINYSGNVSINIKTSIVKKDENETEKIYNVQHYLKKNIAKIPIMLQSSKCILYNKTKKEKQLLGECENDNGGYFIIKGKERVLVSQERMNNNVIYVFQQKPSPKYEMIAEIRSMSEETRHSVFIQMKIHHNKIVLQIPFIQQDIPLGIILRAYNLEIETIKKILQINNPLWKENKTIRNYLESIILDAEKIESYDNAISYICEYSVNTIMKERKKKYIEQILNNEIFPHLSICSTNYLKSMFLGYMLNKLLLTYIGKRKMDDRDHVNNKRIELSGYLISELFRTLYKRFVRLIEQQLEKRQDIVVITNRSNMITLGINHCFATGNWGVPKSSYIRTGVSQILSRLTYGSFISHLRRVIIPIGKEGKNTKVRQINNSQIGFICPHETPEGGQSGIVKNMTSFVDITLQEDIVFIREILENIPFIETDFQKWLLNEKDLEKPFTKILINGNWVGITYDFEQTWDCIKLYKNIDLFTMNISFHYNNISNEICIFSDEGRMIRPLFPRHNMPTIEEIKTKTFEELLNEKKIEFLDSYQIENEIIAMTKKEFDSHSYYTYCELHPSVISGFSISLIPYPEHTQSPRVTYHAAMGKQAIGLPVSNFLFRMDTTQHILSYPERPLIQSHHAEFNQCNKLPFGNNLIVAVLMFSGFNQEDSVILNRSAIDRGLFHSFCFKTFVIEEKKKNSLMSETICQVPVQYQSKSFDYSKLNDDGIIKVGSYVGIGDVIVSKLQKKNEKKNQNQLEWQDNSVIIKSGEEGYVERVYITSSPDGYKIIKIQVRNIKIPEIGDKVASRSAQKGTISMILNQEDMPCTLSGIVPDLIINPLCIPSRMTINQLIECIAAKNSAHTGKFKYCTAFSKHSQDIIPYLCKELKKNGFNKHGNELMINGMSGELLDSQIFIGPTYYHRLKHMVGSKIHARNHGSLQALTRQPLEGRSRDGGLRFGEMERDTTHFKTPISLKCGLSIPLYEFKDHKKWDVLGWEEESDSIITKRQTEFLDKGEKECVEITLQDGKKLVCTPDHPMLTMDKEWVRAKNLKKNEHRLKVSLHYPIMKLKKDVQKCNNWSMNIGEILLETHSNEHYLNSLSFMRMMGLLCSDGGFYKSGNLIYANVNLGHKFDADVVKDDIQLFTQKDVSIKFCKNKWNGYFNIRLPQDLTNNLLHLEGLTIGKKIDQPIQFPKFILDENLPTPLLREFLGALFGGDGHTCSLTKHRGKRDLLTSISFSRSSLGSNLEHLETYINQLQQLLKRLGIEKTTIQKPKETTWSKNQDRKSTDTKCYQLNLHLDINELLPFHEKIGFRYNCHKSLRLEAGVSYRRLRETTMKQHDWIVNRVNELTDFTNKKKENPDKIVPTKKAIEQATKELQKQEAILHKYAIPTTHDITDHLVKGTKFGSFRSKSFPTAEEFIEQIGALEWFDDDYATKTNEGGLPTMNLKVIDIRPVGKHLVYDIEVDKIHSFLANGIVAHNCMISHGVSRFLQERLFDVSDYFQFYVCSKCGNTPHNTTLCNLCNSKIIEKVSLPYACKLLFQELMAMGIKIHLIPKNNLISN